MVAQDRLAAMLSRQACKCCQSKEAASDRTVWSEKGSTRMINQRRREDRRMLFDPDNNACGKIRAIAIKQYPNPLGGDPSVDYDIDRDESLPGGVRQNGADDIIA